MVKKDKLSEDTGHHGVHVDKYTGLILLRRLVKGILDRIPVETVVKDEALIPGGDLRTKGNSWLRSAFEAAQLKRVPRERQIRLAVLEVDRKKKLRALAVFIQSYWNLDFRHQPHYHFSFVANGCS